MNTSRGDKIVAVAHPADSFGDFGLIVFNNLDPLEALVGKKDGWITDGAVDEAQLGNIAKDCLAEVNTLHEGRETG